MTNFDTIAQFAALIDLMKDPSKFEAQVAEAKKAVEDMKVLLGAKATVEKADAYSQKVDKDVADKYTQLEREQSDLKQRTDDFAAYASKKQDEFIAKEKELDERERAVKQSEIDADKRSKKLDDVAESLSGREQAAIARAAELNAFEASLKEKQAKLEAIFK